MPYRSAGEDTRRALVGSSRERGQRGPRGWDKKERRHFSPAGAAGRRCMRTYHPLPVAVIFFPFRGETRAILRPSTPSFVRRSTVCARGGAGSAGKTPPEEREREEERGCEQDKSSPSTVLSSPHQRAAVGAELGFFPLRGRGLILPRPAAAFPRRVASPRPVPRRLAPKRLSSYHQNLVAPLPFSSPRSVRGTLSYCFALLLATEGDAAGLEEPRGATESRRGEGTRREHTAEAHRDVKH